MGKGDPKGGRPAFELSDSDFGKLVNMVRIQCTQDEICRIFNVTDKTLNEALKRRGEPGFSDFYKKHQDEGKASLRRAQWKAAHAGNPTMLVWLGKQMLGQKDKQEINQENLNTGRIEHVSPDGSMTPKHVLDLTKLPKEALEAIVKAADGQSNDL